jgi:hypothetical protein
MILLHASSWRIFELHFHKWHFDEILGANMLTSTVDTSGDLFDCRYRLKPINIARLNKS